MVVCPACGEENSERAKFCSNCAAPLTGSAPAGEVRKTVTVLFADVTGSTALGEQLDPEAVRALMGRYFAEAKRVIESHGGTVEKFIGDAVMAIFGIPRVHEDDALRGVRAAADLRTSLALARGAGSSARQHGSGSSPATVPPKPRRRQWEFGGSRGRVVCGMEGGDAIMEWSYVGLPLLAVAIRHDGDVRALYTWWRDNGRFRRSS